LPERQSCREENLSMQEDEPSGQQDRGGLTRLGMRMEEIRLASGEKIQPFCLARDIDRTAYYRLIRNRDHTPFVLTVREVAAKIGLDLDEALRLRQLDIDDRKEPGQPAEKTLTELGELMEKARFAAGQTVAQFCAARGLQRTTYYRLAYSEGAPMRATVLKYAAALGLDRREALLAAGLRPASVD
jgi:hypothetical protein